MANITRITEQYIAEHPYIKDCLKKGLINYSSLARQIAAELGVSLKENFDAILIACRRYKRKLKNESAVENRILKILKQSKIEIKNKILVVVIEKVHFSSILTIEKEIKAASEPFNIIEGTNSITIITSEDFLELIRKTFRHNIIKESKNLIEVIIKSPKEIELTPGILHYIFSLFGEHGLNIVETMSCWTDTLLVIDEKDIAKAMEILRF